MEKSAQFFIGVAVLAMVALVLFVVYRWRQQQRVRQVTAWVCEFLSNRYGQRPDALNVNCSDDCNWPVLVSFNDPHNGGRHTAQFACGGQQSEFALVSEKQEVAATGLPAQISPTVAR